MPFSAWPRTDLGTVILHWIAVAATLVLMLTGLRMAADDVGQEWLRDYDWILWSNNLWYRHITAAYALSFAAAGYAVYIPAARLGGRIRLDGTRLRGLFGTARTRWAAVNVALCWVFLGAAAGLLVTGWLAYLGAPDPVLQIHLACTWAVVLFIPAHLLAQFQLGGMPQLARMLRARRSAPPEEEMDLASVVSQLLAERHAARRKARDLATD